MKIIIKSITFIIRTTYGVRHTLFSLHYFYDPARSYFYLDVLTQPMEGLYGYGGRFGAFDE